MQLYKIIHDNEEITQFIDNVLFYVSTDN